MSTCQVKKGMFVLNECGNIAKAQCSECEKNVCGKHAEQDGSRIICVECYAKKEFENSKEPWDENTGKAKNAGVHSMGHGNLAMNSLFYYHWQSRMRHSFYDKHQHQPFDERDYTGFEEINQTEFDDANDTGGFFDS